MKIACQRTASRKAEQEQNEEERCQGHGGSDSTSTVYCSQSLFLSTLHSGRVECLRDRKVVRTIVQGEFNKFTACANEKLAKSRIIRPLRCACMDLLQHIVLFCTVRLQPVILIN